MKTSIGNIPSGYLVWTDLKARTCPHNLTSPAAKLAGQWLMWRLCNRVGWCPSLPLFLHHSASKFFVLQQFVYCPSSQYILFSRERICKLACTLAFEWKWKADCHSTFWWLSECFLCMPTEFLALHQDLKHKLCNTAQRDGVAVCNIWQSFLSRNLKWTNIVFET